MQVAHDLVYLNREAKISIAGLAVTRFHDRQQR
jgi:hypothetical protein